MILHKTSAIEQTAQTMTYGGGSAAVVSGLNANEIGVIAGIIIGLIGLVFQVWVGLRRDKRDAEIHKKAMGE